MKLYTASGDIVTDRMMEFIDNIDVDYGFDSASNANYTVVRVYKLKVDGTKQYPFSITPNLNNTDYTTLELMQTFAESRGFVMAINAGVFDTSTLNVDGIIVENGIVKNNTPATIHAGAIPLTINNQGELSYAEADADAYDLVNNGIVSAFCGFYPIIIGYENAEETITLPDFSHYLQNAQRQIIGQFGNGDYAIISCEGRNFDHSDGWTIPEAQTICKKIGLKFAYNLDGGGSVETVLGMKQINTIYEGTVGRKVSTFIVFNGTNQYS